MERGERRVPEGEKRRVPKVEKSEVEQEVSGARSEVETRGKGYIPDQPMSVSCAKSEKLYFLKDKI